MFKFVNLQSNEIEELETEVGKLKGEMQAYNQKPEDTDKEKYIRNMDEDLERLEVGVKEAEGKYKA